MCGENVVCRTGRVKKCGEKIKQEEEVSSLRLEQARRKERFSFFARKQVLELHSSREEAKEDERFFNL